MIIKTVLAILMFAVTFIAQAQRQSIGLGLVGGGDEPSSNLSVQQQMEQARQWQNQTIIDELGGHPFRQINGKTYNLFTDGQSISGYVLSAQNGIIVLNKEDGYSILDADRAFALKNYSGEATSGKRVETRAMKVGIYNEYGDTPLELYDCGTLLSPQEEKVKLAEIQNALDAQKKNADDAARVKNFITQSNAIVSLIKLATNGDRWAQFSLGEHYLNGRGCVTNRTLAIEWFSKAAAQGDIEASNKLASLQLSPTNQIIVKQ